MATGGDDHPAEARTGKNRRTVTVTRGGAPVADALVTLSRPDELLLSVPTDADGRAAFYFACAGPGEIAVTVTGFQAVPHKSTMTVVGP